MAEKIIRSNFHDLLEEIQRTEGLPEYLSTEAQLWDEILKKEVYAMDGTMVLRMFEYDVHIALSYPEQIPADVPGQSRLALNFPHSAVLYLQDNRNTPDFLECQIRFQDGGTHIYRVPTLKVQSYSLEEIERKHLNILAPFLPLRFRKKMAKDKASGKFFFRLPKEELTSFYHELILLLDREVAGGYLKDDNRDTILSLLRKSLIRVFHQDEELIKEVVRMTEPILELEYEKYMRERDEARAQVQQVTLELENTSKELNDMTQELSQANQKLELQQQELEALRRQLEILQAR